ncbi:MAG: hypothetical protein R2856_23110 [Caldilineaceae bacterium]
MRIAMSPFVSTIGWMLPSLISGTTIVAIVLSLPTTGPLLLKALLSQDMYLAASFIMLLSVPHDPRHADFGHSAGAGGSADSV